MSFQDNLADMDTGVDAQAHVIYSKKTAAMKTKKKMNSNNFARKNYIHKTKTLLAGEKSGKGSV